MQDQAKSAPVRDCASTKYTPELLTGILDALRRGATRTAAAESNGIHRSTLYAWLDASADVSDAIARAEGEFRSRVEQKFGDDAVNGGDWRARESLLKRRYRDDWGDKLDLSGLPDHILLELLGANRGRITAENYPSVPTHLLTGDPPPVAAEDRENGAK